MNIVGSAVQRIRHPAIRFIPVDCRTFLHNETGFGQKSFQCGDNTLFRLFIHIGNIVMGMLFLYRFPAELSVLPLGNVLPHGLCHRPYRSEFSNHPSFKKLFVRHLFINELSTLAYGPLAILQAHVLRIVIFHIPGISPGRQATTVKNFVRSVLFRENSST